MFYKNDFPIFSTHKHLIYLDSAATSQKPKRVIQWVDTYMRMYNSNIHRSAYSIATKSEELYRASKKKVASFLWRWDYREIIYTYNANYAYNLLAYTFLHNNILNPGDAVLLSIAEHHANIVPWMILQQHIPIEIKFFHITREHDIDWEDFDNKYTNNVKIISCIHASNVTGTIFDVATIWKKKRQNTLFIVDATQSIPHIPIRVDDIGCDILVFTGHKIMAQPGIGIIWGKYSLLESLQPAFCWWWAIHEVTTTYFSPQLSPEKYEPWTPNIVGAVSLLQAIEYIESIGWYHTIQEHENKLIHYTLEKTSTLKHISLIGKHTPLQRIGVFSFFIPNMHPADIQEFFSEHNICIRSWNHCAQPFLEYLHVPHTTRMSFGIYNTYEDIDAFFDVLSLLDA